MKWGLAVATLGGAIGIGAGAWLGWAFTRLYTVFFHFPVLLYRLNTRVSVLGLAIGLAAAVAGAAGAVRRAVALPPAEAMRPEPPARFAESWPERAGFRRWLSQPTRIILRTLQRHPARAALSVAAVALGASLLVVGTFSSDSIDLMLRNRVRRRAALRCDGDTGQAGLGRRARRILADARRRRAPSRSAPLPCGCGRVRARETWRCSACRTGGTLNRVVDASRGPILLPPAGLVLSESLASLLGVGRGDRVRLEVLEGLRPVHHVVVAAVVDDYLGTSAYMSIGALHRLMQEGGTLSGAYLLVDPARAGALYKRLEADAARGGRAPQARGPREPPGDLRRAAAARSGRSTCCSPA